MDSIQDKLTTTITNGPMGFVIGGTLGYLVAKMVGYDKTLSVASFTLVGAIIGASIGYRIKTKI